MPRSPPNSWNGWRNGSAGPPRRGDELPHPRWPDGAHRRGGPEGDPLSPAPLRRRAPAAPILGGDPPPRLGDGTRRADAPPLPLPGGAVADRGDPVDRCGADQGGAGGTSRVTEGLRRPD